MSNLSGNAPKGSFIAEQRRNCTILNLIFMIIGFAMIWNLEWPKHALFSKVCLSIIDILIFGSLIFLGRNGTLDDTP
jgi:hypothetical protein